MKNRVPILVWGDLVNMAKPVVRRTLVGQRAHECMYAWVYLTDYLLVKRIATTLKGMKLDKAMLLQALGTFTTNREIDPHYQHNLEAWC